MGHSKRGVFLAIVLVSLFILSVQSYMITTNLDDSEHLFEPQIESSTPVGQSTIVSIGSFPDGAVEKVSVSVPSEEVVQTLGLDIESASLPTSTAFSFSKSLDFSSSQYYSGVDVNSSSLSLLPQEWKWDFESGSFSSDWAQCSSSCWSIQNSNV